MQVNTSHNDKTTGSAACGLFRATKVVFTASWTYVSIAAVIAAVFWIVFASFDQLLFFSPLLTFYLPEDAIGNFVLSTITAAILGMVISMNVYALRRQQRQGHSLNNHGKKIGTTSAASIFSGSSLGILSTACASCSSSLAFVLLSIFGSGLGVTVSTFLSNYQTPLRIVSVAILLWSYYSISKSLSTKSCCPIPSNNNLTNNNNN